jgi:2-polyprenyl-3-methyl-5-hydroxy-6-metoxy-1,4-benzoquinol methylase
MERQDSMMEMAYKFGRRMNLRWKRKLIDRYWRGSTARSPGRLLDVGCGTGEFMGVMKRVGWYVQGMERNREAVQWAGKTWGVPVYAGNLAEFHPEKPFDVITLWHVLEHLYDPVQALNHLKGLLTIDGFFLVAVPNAGGVDAGLYGSNWVALDTPRHVNHFSARTLAQLFRAIGLEIVLRRQLPFDAPFNALLSEQLSARRVRSSGFSWPFRLCRAGLIAMGSLAGGSRVFSARFGASLVFLARRTANMP